MNRPGRGWSALKAFIERPPALETCDLCSIPLREEHQHLVDPKSRRIVCSCDPCAILFCSDAQTKFRRIPRDPVMLTGFEIEDSLWNGLAIPIGLVFFFKSSATGEVVAIYPSPAGPTETILEADTWDEIAALHPALADMPSDTVALLANRIGMRRQYYIAPIDQCYKLTGIIRAHWRGFSGGADAWREVDAFFERMQGTARVAPAVAHA